MANDSNETGFTGFRYLIDANNTRQYALEFVNGEFKRPVHVFAKEQSEAKFTPGETIFAFESDPKVVTGADGKLVVEATPVQLTVDATGLPTKAIFGKAHETITYKMGLLPGQLGSAGVLKLVLSSDSEDILAIAGFAANFPKSFAMAIDSSNPALTTTNNGVNINKNIFNFPPQQTLGAIYAREGVRSLQKVSTAIATKKDNLSSTFNNPDSPRQASLNPKAAGYSRSDSEIETILKKYASDLTEKAARGKLRPVIGREKDTVESLIMMSRLEQGSICFTGDAGVGKSAMFAAVAQYLTDNEDLPENLQGARVIQLDLQAMNAGAQYRGQFEERLKPLIDGLQERGGWFKGRKIILAIDEIHSQLTSGKAEGGTDAANIMKPFLAAEGISVMGTTTTDEYRKHIEKDPALSRRFEEKVLDQPNEAQTLQILKEGVWPMMKEHHNLTENLTDADFEYIVTMSNRYAPNDAQPSKSKKVVDAAAAGAQFRGESAIRRSDIIRAISQMSKLPEEFLAQEDYDRLATLEDQLEDRVLGQNSALSQIADTLIGARSGLGDPNKPLGCFVLQGPPGTGKTETAKALAYLLFGTEDALIKLDGSDYMEKHDVAKLTGAPPGYVGFDDAKPALTDRIRTRPYSILLIDEVEKMHPDALNVLLAPLNDGEMKDNKGKTASFKNVLVLMTSNLGAKDGLEAIKKKANGMGLDFSSVANKLSESEQAEKILSKVYAEARQKHFRPEFMDRVNELGGFITFVPLQRDSIELLTTREIGKINSRMSDRSGAALDNVTVSFSREIMDQLAAEGYVADAGARPLKGLVRRKITNPLAAWLLKNKEEVIAFAKDNNGAKLVIDSLTDFAPRLVAPVEKVAVVSNDNASVKKTKKAANKIKGP